MFPMKKLKKEDIVTIVGVNQNTKIIAELLGFPESEEHLLRPWSQAIVKMYEVNPSEQYQMEAKKAADDDSQEAAKVAAKYEKEAEQE